MSDMKNISSSFPFRVYKIQMQTRNVKIKPKKQEQKKLLNTVQREGGGDHGSSWLMQTASLF